jgi:hypothetical protein
MAAPLARLALIACAIALFAGCATVRHPPLTASELLADGQRASAMHRTTIDRTVERLARRAVRRGDRTLDVLYLSGGGQNGAYGVGFMQGWRERPGAPMPTFDLVTGVSTGALQAPFVFVGTEAALDTIAELYGEAVTTAAPTLDALFWLRKTGAVMKVGNFRRAIRRVVDRKLAAEMRAGFAEDRQLAIATTDMDLGSARLWDIEQELTASPAGLERTHDVMVASSAIPGILPAVILDRHVHADGGVMVSVAAPLDLDALRALSERLASAGVEGPVTVRLWLIMNLWTHPETSVLNPASRGSLTRRLTLLLHAGQQLHLIESIEALSKAVQAEVPGLRLEFHATSVPSELAEDPATKVLVDAEWMKKLAKLGYERAQSAAPWDVGIPGPYERPEIRPHTEN